MKTEELTNFLMESFQNHVVTTSLLKRVWRNRQRVNGHTEEDIDNFIYAYEIAKQLRKLPNYYEIEM